MDIQSVFLTILSPSFLVENIDTIGQIISVLILLIFDDFFTQKIAFGWTDSLKTFILLKSKEKFRKRHRIIIKYTFEFMATILFIAYFFMGYWVLSEYVVVPVLMRIQSIILIVVIGFFLLMSWMLNNRKVRRRYLGY